MAMPYDHGDVIDLIRYVRAYQYLVSRGESPELLYVSVHNDGWFTFDSEATHHDRLPASAFRASY